MSKSAASLSKLFDAQCTKSVVGSEWSLHQIAPYIGKVKSSIAKFLIENFTKKGDVIYDPFCGAGTIPFEAWSSGRNVIANDLNDYAYVLTKAKLFPPSSFDEVYSQIEAMEPLVSEKITELNRGNIPEWVSAFFHDKTLLEVLAWVEILKANESWFLLSCLLGILHHQRPGFLSFPSSHTVPYLRVKKFPKEDFPELYEYRNVKDRLVKKVKRALKRSPNLNENLERTVYNEDASEQLFQTQIDAVITSPPYMRQLDYARDNRLRLWFLGVEDYRPLDATISPKELDFIDIISKCLNNWNDIIRPGGKCILFLGDNYSKKLNLTLPEILEDILVKKIGDFNLIFKHESIIPTNRRVRRNHVGNKSETVLVFQKD
ncbi:DNA methyltransferase [Chitinophaga ginsengisegetis]|uniref:DNA methyltransferase n=1 Tax=Chitinophaga ginsengisegetis TaxID=393003 RepID=UPI000DBAD252|nr:DNA methyltransferase [Chitinophaga ginsengisegetis]MDR6569936.1 16S rRNA G966 N2-methylase RsmD [Chitinophaga ginsengisegetis]MDR6649669.1 16S rRNA G966 N2-methylase RsmD [Chitinophaga ginsengisegetis]MDR6656128.1 16S rRNA G966 N2-methylase RsmD [Chitinophaga ginsengisegetis]